MFEKAWYEDFYASVGRSPAYSAYCEKVFGRDFSQHGFSDLAQVDAMLAILRPQKGSRILDIGCGNGKMLEHITGATGAIGYGFDFSETAIAQASDRTKDKADTLTFEVGCIGEKQYPPGSFDTVFSVDTMYFTDDLPQTIRDIRGWLKPGGRFAAFFSEFRLSESDGPEMLAPDGNALAKAFAANGWGYRYFDFTEAHYRHMRLKRQVISQSRDAFTRESNQLLYDSAFIESIGENMSYEQFRAFSTRYLYIAEKE